MLTALYIMCGRKELYMTLNNTHADWWKQAVVYQVYPRSFKDVNGDGLGDIAGVTDRIPYLKELGVDAIWLSPFYPSELADGGYDVIDYRDVDPRLGTMDDFDVMAAAAHEAGMKVIVDIVPNHTSDGHVWFQEALAAEPGSPARDRYIFRDGLGEHGELPPNDWQSIFGGGAWERVSDGQWYLHMFAKEQPDLNWKNPEVHEEFKKTLRFWSDHGADGFRIDVAHGLAKDLDSAPLTELALRGNPLEGLCHDGTNPLWDRPEVHDIYREWREVFNEYDPPRFAVGEAWVVPEHQHLYASEEELGQVFNFEFAKADWFAEDFRTAIREGLESAEESGSTTTWVMSNHDVVRHASRYGLPQVKTQWYHQLADAWLLRHPPRPRRHHDGARPARLRVRVSGRRTGPVRGGGYTVGPPGGPDPVPHRPRPYGQRARRLPCAVAVVRRRYADPGAVGREVRHRCLVRVLACHAPRRYARRRSASAPAAVVQGLRR